MFIKYMCILFVDAPYEYSRYRRTDWNPTTELSRLTTLPIYNKTTHDLSLQYSHSLCGALDTYHLFCAGFSSNQTSLVFQLDIKT
jgi:hypothetical protein